MTQGGAGQPVSAKAMAPNSFAGLAGIGPVANRVREAACRTGIMNSHSSRPELALNPSGPVQRQLDAYNAHDLKRFVAEYSDDVQVFSPPATEPVLSGKEAFAAHYAKNRFTLPALHAEVVNRMVAGSIVVDHERVTGLTDGVVEGIAVYQVVGESIRTVWFY